MRILRVFPRRTAATPDDDLVRIGYPDLFPPECDEIHVSVVFTYDLPKAERVAEAWRHIGVPVKIGGPALDDPGGEFVPGRYLKPGYVITSRGCPNRCWFCMAAKREGDIRELPITEGWNVLDNNLLACSDDHIFKVFEMLSRQSEKAIFTGGLEAERMTQKLACRIALLKPRSVYFAYDAPNDLGPLVEAVRMMREADSRKSHWLSCYVLIGHKNDTLDAAEQRLRFVASLGVLPFAMLYRDDKGQTDRAWRKFQKYWCRPAAVGAKVRQIQAEARP